MQEGRITRAYRLASMHTYVGSEALDDRRHSCATHGGMGDDGPSAAMIPSISMTGKREMSIRASSVRQRPVHPLFSARLGPQGCPVHWGVINLTIFDHTLDIRLSLNAGHLPMQHLQPKKIISSWRAHHMQLCPRPRMVDTSIQ